MCIHLKKSIKPILITLLLCLITFSFSACDNNDSKVKYTVSSINGTALLINDSGTVELSVGDVVTELDSIATDANSSITLNIGFAKEIVIDELSEIMICKLKASSKDSGEITSIALKQGAVISNVAPLTENDIYEVSTPDIIMAICGTTTYTSYHPDTQTSEVLFLTGEGLVFNDNTSTYMYAGKMITYNNTDKMTAFMVDEDNLPEIAKNFLNKNPELLNAYRNADLNGADKQAPINMKDYKPRGVNNSSNFYVLYTFDTNATIETEAEIIDEVTTSEETEEFTEEETEEYTEDDTEAPVTTKKSKKTTTKKTTAAYVYTTAAAPAWKPAATTTTTTAAVTTVTTTTKAQTTVVTTTTPETTTTVETAVPTSPTKKVDRTMGESNTIPVQTYATTKRNTTYTTKKVNETIGEVNTIPVQTYATTKNTGNTGSKKVEQTNAETNTIPVQTYATTKKTTADTTTKKVENTKGVSNTIPVQTYATNKKTTATTKK